MRYGRTDRPTDGPTDGRTNRVTYRVACTRLINVLQIFTQTMIFICIYSKRGKQKHDEKGWQEMRMTPQMPFTSCRRKKGFKYIVFGII